MNTPVLKDKRQENENDIHPFLTLSPLLGATRPYVPGGVAMAISVGTSARPPGGIFTPSAA